MIVSIKNVVPHVNRRLILIVTVGLSWSVPFGDLVAMTITNSARFELDGEDSALEWAALIPRGGHTVHVMQPGDNQPTTYTVTLFHQLKCLDFIRQDFVYMNRTNAGPNIMTSHCVNYLRQTILCRPNLRLESVRNTHLNAGRMQYDAACNDWERVYEETGRNHAAYAAWRNESSI